MAYKQSPGRGNNAKTGHGIPSPFKQSEDNFKTKRAHGDIAKKEEIGYTIDDYNKGKKFASEVSKADLSAQGTKFNPATGNTEPKTYEKSLKTGKELGLKNADNDMFVTNASGGIVKKAEARNTNAVKSLKKEYETGKSTTDDARKANSMYQNNSIKIGGGAKKY